MDCFNDVFTAFVGLESSSCVGCQWRDRKLSDFIKKIFICVLKMNESLTGLERHKGEKIITEFILGELTLSHPVRFLILAIM